ncbi:MAG: hypothetical protein FJY75_09895 [Candidatus Eisenbacteria bacterium]|uniref:Tetratricopeptide repeat protein n=1 Tax=Eiseniibacteriota bacterium TaxID=2212470 RepID=A0A937XAB6_UNCEI|nr:hypothetical protein [Candidatus Eisenbacteria bacterium]
MSAMSKQELREDPVMERIQRVVSFAERHARWIVVGAVAAAVAILALVAVQKSQARSALEAAQALTEGQASYLTGNHPMAESQLREMLQRYGHTRAAGPAHLFLGHALRDQGRALEALEAYDKAVGKVGADAELQAAVQRGRGAALADLARYEDASRAYEQAAAKGRLQRIEDLIAAGRCALRAGDTARAQQILGGIDRDQAGERLAQVDFWLAQAGGGDR